MLLNKGCTDFETGEGHCMQTLILVCWLNASSVFDMFLPVGDLCMILPYAQWPNLGPRLGDKREALYIRAASISTCQLVPRLKIPSSAQLKQYPNITLIILCDRIHLV